MPETLHIYRDDERLRAIPLEGCGLEIGRRASNDVVLDDPTISKQHAAIVRKGDSWYIEDRGSTNGVLVEGARIRSAPLTLGKEFQLGAFRVVLVDEEEEPTGTIPAPKGAPRAAYEDLLALFRLTGRFSSVMSTEELLDTLVDRLIEVFGADRGMVLLGEDPDAGLEVAVRRGAELTEEEAKVSRSLTREALEKGEPVLRVGEGAVPQSVEQDVRSVLCAPLVDDGARLGVVYLDSRLARRIYGDRDKELLGLACESVVAAYRGAAERERLEREVRARRRLARNDALKDHDFRDIVGDSPALRESLEQVAAVAPQDVTVLLEGESGTGKELFAKALHYGSPRRDNPFVAIHCMALAPEILESELFGHEKGSFSGAVERRVGKLELADGGTVFLDEIGELSPGVQVKLLRVLQERELQRVGGNETIRLDIRVVAATNVDLKKSVAAGSFREDLYYRLNVFALQLPPLRARRQDIPALVDHFVDHFNESMGRAVDGVSGEAMEVLRSYSWPGNIRELRNVIERAMVLTQDGPIQVRALPFDLREGGSAGPGAGGSGSVEVEGDLDMNEAKEALEKKMVLEALEENGGNISAAARELGIQRKTLHRKIELHGIDMRRFGKDREALTREDVVLALEKVKGSISAAARELGVPRTTLYRTMDLFGVDADEFRAEA